MATDSWSLPKKAEINGKIYNLNTDYRDILNIIEKLNNDWIWAVKQKVLIALFYCEYKEMPACDYTEATQYLFDFISCGEEDDGRPQPKQIDWEQDSNMIAAEINKVIGQEIRFMPYMHWFTFIGYFCAIGEGQLSHIVNIRHKLATGKALSKEEREFYTKNKQKIKFKEKLSDEEQAERERINKMLDG